MSKALPRSVGRTRANTTESEAEDFVDSEAVQKKTKRHASVYDAVAGLGNASDTANGSLQRSQLACQPMDSFPLNHLLLKAETRYLPTAPLSLQKKFSSVESVLRLGTMRMTFTLPMTIFQRASPYQIQTF